MCLSGICLLMRLSERWECALYKVADLVFEMGHSFSAPVSNSRVRAAAPPAARAEAAGAERGAAAAGITVRERRRGGSAVTAAAL